MGSLVAWPFLAGGVHRAVVGGAILALGTQMATHFLLMGWRNRNDRFVTAILAAFAARVAVVVLSVVVHALAGLAEPIPFLLSLGGFLIALLLAESVHEHRRFHGGAVPAES